MFDLSTLTPVKTTDPPRQLIVRVRTSFWYSNNGCNTKKTITIIVRKSDKEYAYCTSEEMSEAPELFLGRVTNLDAVEDGLYYLNVINEYRDWESGYVEDWDYELVQYTEETNE